MRVAIHQPHYLPWLGYFHKMDQVDCFVILDQVQFEKNEWQNRNRIRTQTGWQWLTVPVLHRFPQQIVDVQINNAVTWPRRHLNALIGNYGGAQYFEAHRPFFEEVFARRWTRLVDLCLVMLSYFVDVLDIRTRLVPASSLPEENGATDRLVRICQALGAETYLSGIGGHHYLNLWRFEEAGIRVEFQAFHCPSYPQRFQGFTPNLSIVDLLFNCGEASLYTLRGGRSAGECPGDRRAS